MGAMASQITSLAIVYSTVYSGADQKKHQSPASLAFVRGIHRWPVNSPHTWPVTRKMFPFDAVIIHYWNQRFNWTFRNRLKWNLNQSWNIFFLSLCFIWSHQMSMSQGWLQSRIASWSSLNVYFSVSAVCKRATPKHPLGSRDYSDVIWASLCLKPITSLHNLEQLGFFNVIVMSRNSIYIILFKKSWQCLRYGQHIFEKKMHIHLS